MKNRVMKGLLFICLVAVLFVGKGVKLEAAVKKNIVVTTTMLDDLVKNLVGDKIEVNSLMKAGVDPHLFKASAGDLTTMEKADMIVYGGLHLEGKLTDVFEQLIKKGKNIVDSSVGIPKDIILPFEEGDAGDPHIWFDIKNWKIVTEVVAAKIIELDPENKSYYEERTKNYLAELDETQKKLDKKLEELPVEKRILVTAHDAFEYFGKANQFEVRGLQGISTDAEAGTKDIKELADFIVEKKVKAIFVESSVPKKNVEALQEAVHARGFNVVIGGELYSDSIGDEGTPGGTYIGMLLENMDTIVNALK